MACGAKGDTKTRLDTPGYPAETRAVVSMMMECVCVCMKGVGHAANLYHLDADGVGVHSATQARNAAGRKTITQATTVNQTRMMSERLDSADVDQ